jgi:adenylate cyclase
VVIMTAMPKLFAELKRRNLFRVAALYLVGGWVILQVADVLFGLLELPGWTLRWVAAILVLGFPVALVFAWVYEMTPEGLKPARTVSTDQSITAETGRKLNTVITVVLVVAVLLLIGDRVLHPQAPAVAPSTVSLSGQSVTPDKGSPAPQKQSVAVLPFVDMSPARDQEYFTDGLTENLLNGLAQVPGLQVAGRTSSFAFKGRNEDLRTVGEQLGVANILEGSVQKSGERIRITAQLVNARDGYHLWSQTFDRTLEDIFAVQDEIAVEVTKALKVALLGEQAHASELHGSSANPEAYTEYLKGRYAFKLGTIEDALNAIQHYQKAINLDPSMALAWAGLAAATAWYTGYSDDFSAGYERARAAANKALALDSSLPEGYLALADIQSSYDWDWAGTENSLKQALSLRPGDAEILREMARQQTILGRKDEAYRLVRQAALLDPLDWNVQAALANSYFAQGHYDKALEIAMRKQEVNPDAGINHWQLGRIREAMGQPEAALAEFKLEKMGFLAWCGQAVILERLGRHEEALAARDQLMAEYGESASYQLAGVYAQWGDVDSAIEWLKRGYEIRDPGLVYIKAERWMDPLRDDPRFQELMVKMRLAD